MDRLKKYIYIEKSKMQTQHIVHTNFLTLGIYLLPLIDLFG
jgi:hypothetical protein